ncbi:MAG: hypothetical protein GY778_01340 [bacterium]|nr:hypothetical protein [bacterium]
MPAQLASACDVSSLFDVAVVRAILERGVLAAGPLKGRLRDVRVERYWPVRRGGISLEWSFHVGDGLRHSVFARPMPTAPCYDDRPAISTEVGLANIRVSLPERKLLVHSPDRDPELPHLAECLDGHRVAKHLESAIRHRTTAARDGGAPCPIPLDRRICCRPVGYRAGRRAAIAYSPYGNGDVSAWMLGKT